MIIYKSAGEERVAFTPKKIYKQNNSNDLYQNKREKSKNNLNFENKLFLKSLGFQVCRYRKP